MQPANARILTVHGGSSGLELAWFETADSRRRILESGLERLGLSEAT